MRQEQQLQREADQSLQELRDEGEALGEELQAERDVASTALRGDTADVHELFVTNCPFDATDDAVKQALAQTLDRLLRVLGSSTVAADCILSCEQLVPKHTNRVGRVAPRGGQRYVLVRGEYVAKALVDEAVSTSCHGRTLRILPSKRARSAQKAAAQAVPIKLTQLRLLDLWSADGEAVRSQADALHAVQLWQVHVTSVRSEAYDLLVTV